MTEQDPGQRITNHKTWVEETGTKIVEDDYMSLSATEYIVHYELTLEDGSTVRYWQPRQGPAYSYFK